MLRNGQKKKLQTRLKPLQCIFDDLTFHPLHHYPTGPKYVDASKFVRAIREFTDLLLVINSATNLPIYLFFFNQFRECFLKTFCSAYCEKALQGGGGGNGGGGGSGVQKSLRQEAKKEQMNNNVEGEQQPSPPKKPLQLQQSEFQLEGTKKAWIHSNNKGSLTISDLQAASGDVYLGGPSPTSRVHDGGVVFNPNYDNKNDAEEMKGASTENSPETCEKDSEEAKGERGYVEIEA